MSRNQQNLDQRVPKWTLALLLSAVLATAATGAEESATPPLPNLVVVVIDDAGFTDLGAYGSEIRTPNIDRLAAGGVRFTNFHASPMCSPSRAMLLTGVDSHTAGLASLKEAMPASQRGQPGYEGTLRSDVITVATRLREAGYRTYLSGKWNLGHTPENLPSARGFDRTFALDATGADNYEKKTYLPIYDEVPWFEDGQPTDLPEDFYSSASLVTKLIEFTNEDVNESPSAPPASPTHRKTDQRPFFAYLAFQAIHMPVQAPREFTERYAGFYDRGWEWLREERHRRAVSAGLIPPDAPPSTTPTQRDWDTLSAEEKALFSKSMAVQAGMLEAMDHHLGRYVDYLKDIGEFHNTVFFILSDNGPEAGDPTRAGGRFDRWLESMDYSRDVATLGEKGSYAFIGADFAAATASPLAFYKFHGGEGGVRVPLIVSGAALDAPNTETTRGTSTAAFSFITDIVPTLLELAGVEWQADEALIGRSLLPTLLDPDQRVHPNDEPVGFETAGNAGVFKGDHKLVRVGAPAGDGVWRLYDLARDPGEVRDLRSVMPRRFDELMADYEAYAAKVGVLELPESYSPTRQIGINLVRKTVRDNSLALLASVLVIFVGLAVFLRWSLQRRNRRAATRRTKTLSPDHPKKGKGLRMTRRILSALAVLAVLIATVAVFLPAILHAAGLHPDFESESPLPRLEGKRALIITTSHGVLSAPGKTTGRKTGVFASEMTAPYYVFDEAGMSVDVASVQGGEIPVDPQSFYYMVRTAEDERYLEDSVFRDKVQNSLRIDDVDMAAYDAVFLAGGWGAAYDLGQSAVLGKKISQAYQSGRAIIGSVCHGALGLIRATSADGSLLAEGRRLTGVTDKQVNELGIDMTPMHPETELRKAGAVFESATAFRDVFANHVVVDDEQRFVTGQNQNGGRETAFRMVELIAQRP